MFPDFKFLSDPRSHVWQALTKVAQAMNNLADSNNRLAEAIERNGMPR